MEVQPQILVARRDYGWKLIATVSAEKIGETVLAVSHLQNDLIDNQAVVRRNEMSKSAAKQPNVYNNNN